MSARITGNGATLKLIGKQEEIEKVFIWLNEPDMLSEDCGFNAEVIKNMRQLFSRHYVFSQNNDKKTTMCIINVGTEIEGCDDGSWKWMLNKIHAISSELEILSEACFKNSVSDVSFVHTINYTTENGWTDGLEYDIGDTDELQNLYNKWRCKSQDDYSFISVYSSYTWEVFQGALNQVEEFLENNEHPFKNEMNEMISDFEHAICAFENKAQRWGKLIKEAENKDAYSQYYLGHHYYGEYTLSWAESSVGLGLMINNDKNYKPDYNKAFFWWSKSAEQGFGNAQKMLGICYINGKGVAKDCKKGVEWLAKAAQQEHDAGRILIEAAEQSTQWLIEAAEQGSHEAKELLEKSIKKMMQAAEQGDVDEQYQLGNYYLGDEFFYGSDIAKDYEKAIYWYTKAAEQGHGDAHCALGYLYKSGEFIPQDYEKAIFWLTKAMKLGDDVELVDYDDPAHLLEEIMRERESKR